MFYAKRLIISLISIRSSLLLLFATVTITIPYIFLIYVNYNLENMTPISVFFLTDVGAIHII